MIGLFRNKLCQSNSFRMHPVLRVHLKPMRTYAVKTCYRFDDEDEDNNEENYNIHLTFQRMKQTQVSCLNKLYYNCQDTDSCCGDDLVDWMKQKWGKAHVMKLVRVNGEMNLRVYREELSIIDDGSTSPVGDFYDEIVCTLNDSLRMEYVKYQLLTKMNSFKHGSHSHLDIPLSIYYDGTM